MLFSGVKTQPDAFAAMQSRQHLPPPPPPSVHERVPPPPGPFVGINERLGLADGVSLHLRTHAGRPRLVRNGHYGHRLVKARADAADHLCAEVFRAPAGYLLEFALAKWYLAMEADTRGLVPISQATGMSLWELSAVLQQADDISKAMLNSMGKSVAEQPSIASRQLEYLRSTWNVRVAPPKVSSGGTKLVGRSQIC